MIAPTIYSKLDADIADDLGREGLTAKAYDAARVLAEQIEQYCIVARDRGPEVRLAVSPLMREDISFVHKFAFIDGPWISPEFSGWMIYGPFPPANQ